MPGMYPNRSSEKKDIAIAVTIKKKLFYWSFTLVAFLGHTDATETTKVIPKCFWGVCCYFSHVQHLFKSHKLY